MKTKNRFLTLLLVFVTSWAIAQTKSTSADVVKENEKIYLIHVDESSDSGKFFPKLYPIGFIVKKTDESARKTDYFLGDFKSDSEARDVLKTVHSLGYRKAFIVESTK